jgi:HSP20 family protein
MSLVKWDPFRELNLFPGSFGRLMDRDWEKAMSTTEWNPSVDIFETDSDIVVKVEAPGMNPKDFDVRLENNALMLKGERKFEKETKQENYHRVERSYGGFSRSFALPTGVKEDKITAEYRDGILKIVLPKKEEVKPKSIKIEAA